MRPTSETEKRTQSRANLKIPLAVYEHPIRQLLGYAVDISAGGFRVYSETWQECRTPLWVSISLPLQRNTAWQEVAIQIQPVWSHYDPADKVTIIGFKFLDIEPNALFAIQKLMDEYSSLA